MNALEGRFLEVENRVVRNEGIVQEATRRVEGVENRQTKLEEELAKERERGRKERMEETCER
jgi:hypothetical protein